MSPRMVTKRLQANCQARRTDQQPPDQQPKNACACSLTTRSVVGIRPLTLDFLYLGLGNLIQPPCFFRGAWQLGTKWGLLALKEPNDHNYPTVVVWGLLALKEPNDHNYPTVVVWVILPASGNIAISRIRSRWTKWLEREFTDKIRGSNPTYATRLPLSRLTQPGSIPALVPPSCGMTAKHRKGATAEREL
ncbi:hypothetical protein T265_01897 [Opisthorchis viverrini]|uniref:Uncharacterized protein n=1 Tax=Opisthorchis viverrini TaxID=6198 RepID=A0A075AIN9_OPIVI|nr:hypothetical protein T265_01897 [Opisthorchis viverrini]KER31964.1 hypothetical protein T265_01897 [Opisthorchis viverrini]